MRQFLLVVCDGLCKAHGNDRFCVVVVASFHFQNGSVDVLNDPGFSVFFCRFDFLSQSVKDSNPDSGGKCEGWSNACSFDSIRKIFVLSPRFDFSPIRFSKCFGLRLVSHRYF